MLLLVAACGSASAELLYGSPASSGICKGKEIDTRIFIYRMYVDRPCHLPIVNREHMRKFEINVPGSVRLQGCWGQLLGGRSLLIFDDGRQEIEIMEAFAQVSEASNHRGMVLKEAYYGNSCQ